MALRLSALAERDIESILRYTLNKWGKTQFDKYYHLLESTLAEITADPYCLTCRKRDDLFRGAYTKSFGQHIVFYRVTQSDVEVVRILHQIMDHRSHL